MNRLRISATFLAAALSLPALAEPMPAMPPAAHLQGADGDEGRAPDAGPGPGERRGPGGHRFERGPGLRLDGIALSEAQQDRLFAIRHAEAPRLRELDKAERKARETLHEMAASGEFSEARAAVHSRALGDAVAARELLRVRTASQVLAVLTPEQRAQLKAERGAAGQP